MSAGPRMRRPNAHAHTKPILSGNLMQAFATDDNRSVDVSPYGRTINDATKSQLHIDHLAAIEIKDLDISKE